MEQKNLLFTSFSLAFIIIFFGLSLIFPLSPKNLPCALASIENPPVQSPETPDIIEDQAAEEKRKEALEIYKLGELYAKQKNWDEAIKQFRKALNLDSDLAEAHLNLGWSYVMKRSEYDLALQETLEAIRLKPDLFMGYRNLWWIYRLQKKYDKSLEALKKAIQLEPGNAINYLNLGDAYVNDTRDFNLAVQSYQKGLELDPNNFYIHRNLGKVYEFQKKYDLAIAEHNKAIKIMPSDPYNYLFLAVTLGKAGKKDEIPPLMNRALNSLPENLIMSSRWDVLLIKFYTGDLSEEDLFSKAELNPINKCQALFYSGLKHIREGKKSKGIRMLSECRSMGIDSLSEYEYSKTELFLLNKLKE
ncbi:MAG: tetratricopeptide repeat protein [bacterium]